MIAFYMILLILVNILLLASLVWVWREKEYWADKYQATLEELYPIQCGSAEERRWPEDDSK